MSEVKPRSEKRRRTHMVNARVTRLELEEVLREAQFEGLTVGQLIRRRLFLRDSDE